jgi:hypothetical protein
MRLDVRYAPQHVRYQHLEKGPLNICDNIEANRARAFVEVAVRQNLQSTKYKVQTVISAQDHYRFPLCGRDHG